MFPTHVGMNRIPSDGFDGADDVPHTRGDEPQTQEKTSLLSLCSPHTWG